MMGLDGLITEINHCRICIERPDKAALSHPPRPVLQVSSTARLAIFGQAPGKRVHETGLPFNDPSGDRLRDWLGLSREVFYDPVRIAIVPMGFCFPGYDARGADLPPRKECAPAWRDALLALMPNIETAVLVGGYAQKWHLGSDNGKNLTETVRRWRSFAPKFYPVAHPSWRNNAWLTRNPWFEAEILPSLRQRVGALVAK